MSILRVLARIEWLKIRKSRPFWVTTGVFATFLTLLTGNSVHNAGLGRVSFALPDAWPRILEPPAAVGPFFLGVLMILLVASEFRWKTSRQNVIDGLSRERFYLGKVLVLAWLVVLFLGVVIGIGGGGALASSDPSVWPWIGPEDFNYMLGFGAALLLMGSGAFLIAVLVRASGPGIGVLFIYVMLENMLDELLGRTSNALETAFAFLPAALIEKLANDLLHYPASLARHNEARAQMGMEPITFPELELLLFAAAACSATFLIVAFASLRRRDL